MRRGVTVFELQVKGTRTFQGVFEAIVGLSA